MGSLRLANLEAWVEVCPGCDALWVEQADRRTLTNLVRRASREQAWGSFSKTERTAIARDLAAAEAPPVDGLVTTLSASEGARLAVGVPVISGATGEARPMVTVLLCLVVAGFFALGLVDEPHWGFEALAWQPQTGLSLTLLTAPWAHAGWVHLVGNLAFLFIFGQLVERRGPHTLVLGTFLLCGVGSTWLQGFASPSTTCIGGASGAVFAFLGLALVLQRQARLKVIPRLFLFGGIGPFALSLPLWVGAAAFFVSQAFWWSLGEQGVAWAAHLAGLCLGVVIGLAHKRLTAPR